MRNFHVPLPDTLHSQLKDAATKEGKPATELAREAINSFLTEKRRRQRHEAIARFAQANAQSELDLDEALEQAGLEHLTDENT